MKTTLFALSSLLALTTAAPAAISTRASGEGNVTFCTGENYTGDCKTISVPFNTCQQLEAPYAKNLGSFKPEGALFCRVTYTADACSLHGDAFIWPDSGAPTLHHYVDVNNEVVDAGSGVTSFLCQECTGCAQ